MSDSDPVIPVEIHGQRYQIRSALDREYVMLLAGYVDEKMRAVAARLLGQSENYRKLLRDLNGPEAR